MKKRTYRILHYERQDHYHEGKQIWSTIEASSIEEAKEKAVIKWGNYQWVRLER